jgi:hypothetical protein
MAAHGSKSLSQLKEEVLALVERIESIREELFDYEKTFGSPGLEIDSLGIEDLSKMRESLMLVLNEAVEFKGSVAKS